MEESSCVRSPAKMQYKKQFAKRFACFLVSSVLVLGLMEPPRARAIVPAVIPIATVAAAFLAACGLDWVVSGMDTSGFADAVGGLLQDYLTTEFGGMTPLEWAAGVACTMTGAGKLAIPKVLAEKMAQFAQWVVGKFGVTAGSVTVVQSNQRVTLPNGSSYMLSSLINSQTDGGTFWSKSYALGTSIPYGTSNSDASVVDFGHQYVWRFYKADGLLYSALGSPISFSPLPRGYVSSYFAVSPIHGGLCLAHLTENGTLTMNATITAFPKAYLTLEGSDIKIKPEQAIAIPDASAMEDDEALAIGTGIAATTLDGMLAAILDAILAGNLTTTQEVVKAEEGTGEAVGEKVGDISIAEIQAQEASLGALFIQKFPFSIPWDLTRAVKLLAAPPIEPRWEVDLLEPIAYRFGGTLGDTTIVIDISDYPIVGQATRWFSTFLFVWGLMLGTKRLIW